MKKTGKSHNAFVLAGFKGSGKTRIGKLLAKRLGYTFLDIDTLIEGIHEKKAGRRMRVRTIYKTFGKDFFLALEARALKEAAKMKGCVISLGGGSPMNDGFSRESFRNTPIIHLKVKRGVLFERIMRKGLPPFLDPERPQKSFEALFRKRSPVYEKIADMTVDNSGRSASEVVGEILEKSHAG